MKRSQAAALAAVSLALAFGCATPTEVKPDRAWDQAAVTQLAGQLATRVQKARATANRETVQVDQMESVSDYLDGLEVLEQQCGDLHSHLQAGEGYKETLWIYDEIENGYRIIQESPEWQLIAFDFEGSQKSIEDSLHQLDAYYGRR